MNDHIWTIKELILWTKNYFTDKNIDSPRLTAELLLAKTLQKNRISLYTNFDKPLTKEELAKYKKLIKRRINGEPTAYILGEKEFWSLNFKVNQHTLIPRPETEILVEKVVEYAKSLNRRINILDIGTGCGNIAISIAKELKNAFIVSVDLSFDALKTASLNKEILKVNNQVFFINADVLEPFKNSNIFDILVSNPPYIKSRDIEKLQTEIKCFEPKLALDGGSEGMKFYEKIFNYAKKVLKNNSKIFFEFGETEQSRKLSEMAVEYGYKDIAIINDYSNSPRVFSCTVK